MSSSPRTQALWPAIVFDTLQAYQRTIPLRGAIHLDLFSGIAQDNHSIKRMFRNTGLTRNELRDLSPRPQRLVVFYK